MEEINASTGWFGRTFLIGREGDRDFIYTPERLGPAYGGINYYVKIEKDGDYEMEGEVWAPHIGSDSFFVEVFRHENGGRYRGYEFASGLTKAHWRFEFAPGRRYGDWCVIKVNHVNVYVKPEQRIIPITYHLEKGEYLIKISMREDGTKLSNFRFVKVGPGAEETFADIAKMARDEYGIEINIEKAVRLDIKDLGTIMFAPPKSPLFRDYSDVERGIILGAVYVDLTKEIYTYADRESKIKIPQGAYLLKATGKVGEWIPTEYIDKERKVVVKTNQIHIRKLPRLKLFEHVKEPIVAAMEFPGSGVISVYCANESAPADATYVDTGPK